MSPLMARELACRVAQGAAVGEVLQTFAQQWRAGDYAFVGADLDGVPRLFAFYPQALGLEHVRKYPSASAAADCLLGDDAAWGRGGERPRLRKVVQRALARLDRRMQRLEGDRAACKGADEAQQLGELLTANLHRVRKGMSRIEVENYYRQGTVVSIDLDPALPPAANADRLFSRSRKLRRAEEHIARRKQQSADEKQWLEALLLDIGEAESGEALAAVAEEMHSYGLLPREASKGVRRGKGPKPGLRRACSPGGYTLVWGKNNRANDDLVKHVCRPRDLWFHALGVPGSHLVLKRDSQAGEVSEADILYAASLAAGFSRAANEEWVEVMVAEGRQVRKVKGALPGLVQVARYRTVRVAPSREV